MYKSKLGVYVTLDKGTLRAQRTPQRPKKGVTNGLMRMTGIYFTLDRCVQEGLPQRLLLTITDFLAHKRVVRNCCLKIPYQLVLMPHILQFQLCFQKKKQERKKH